MSFRAVRARNAAHISRRGIVKDRGANARLHQESNRQGGGTLSIGTIDSVATYYLTPYVNQLRGVYPELAIRLQPDREEIILNKIKEGEFDLGLILASNPKVLRANDIEYRIGMELGNPEAIKRCVMAGNGISLMPRMAAEDEIRRGGLVVLPFSHPEIRLELHLVKHPKKWISHALAAFIFRLRGSEPEERHVGR